MKLSLWILRDWLEEFSPAIQCKRPKSRISGIRLYQPDTQMKEHALYLGTSDTFFQDGGKSIVCRHQEDFLRLETEDFLSVFNRIQDAFSFYARWFDRCSQAIVQGCSLSDLVDFSAEVFSAPILIVNAAQILVAQSSDITAVIAPEDRENVEEFQSLPEEKLKQFNQAYKDSFYATGIITIPAGFFPTKSYCKHIFVNEERLATVIIKAPEKDFTPGALHLLELFAFLVEKWIRANMETVSSFRVTSNFTRSLDGRPGALSALHRQLSLLGWKSDCKKQVFVVSALSGVVQFDMNLNRSLSNENLGVYAAPYQDKLVVLCNLDMVGYQEFTDRLCAIMARDSYCGAASFCLIHLDQLPKSYLQVLTALEHSPHVPGKLYRCQDVATRMVAKIVDDYTAAALLHPALTAIKAHDQQYKTHYYQTLFCFLRNERRHQQTAEELFVHRNTLFLRLEKIQDLWPMNLEDTEERFYLLFSFYQDHYARSSDDTVH